MQEEQCQEDQLYFLTPQTSSNPLYTTRQTTSCSRKSPITKSSACVGAYGGYFKSTPRTQQPSFFSRFTRCAPIHPVKYNFFPLLINILPEYIYRRLLPSAYSIKLFHRVNPPEPQTRAVFMLPPFKFFS